MQAKQYTDLKILEAPIEKGLPKFCQYVFFLCLGLFGASIVYSGVRMGIFFCHKREHEQVLAQNREMAVSLKAMEKRMGTIDRLKTTFDAHQGWLTGNRSMTRVWDAILKSFPETIAIQEASLKTQEETLKLKVKFQALRSVEKTKPTSHFVKGLLEKGYSFELKGEGRSKKKSTFFEGLLSEAREGGDFT